MSTNSIDLTALARHGRALHQLATDAKVDPKDGLHTVSYDTIHDHCRAVLGALAVAGHRRSHELLNPTGAKNPAVTGDSKAALGEEARQLIGSIGI
jgi:hypothetical protein